MMFVFAYLGSFNKPSGWPLHLIYKTEVAFVIVAFVSALLAINLRTRGTPLMRDVVAFVGGVCASFGLIMPFELAPFFFGAHGEIMLATIALNLVYPIAAVLFTIMFRKFMNVPPKVPSGGAF
jgi:thiosulfate dehydrogenase (quinone) large subunit